MKHKLLTLAILLFGYTCAWAQATSLTIDLETPGTLLEKINFQDRSTLQELRVTGYINNDDLTVMAGMIDNANLKVLDLENALICSDYVITNELSTTKFQKLGKSFRKFILPKALITTDLSKLLCGTYLDTLIINGTMTGLGIGGYTSVSSGTPEGTWEVKCVYVPEGVKSFDCGYCAGGAHVNTTSLELFLPTTLKSISSNDYGNSSNGANYVVIHSACTNNVNGVRVSTYYSSPSYFYPFYNGIAYIPVGTRTMYEDIMSPFKYLELIEEDPPVVEKVSFYTDTMQMQIKKQKHLYSTVLPYHAINKKVIYEIENPSIGTVDTNGLVTALAVGTTRAFAYSFDRQVSDTCLIVVTSSSSSEYIPVKAVSMEKHNTTLNVDGEETLYAIATPLTADNRNLTWSSSDYTTVSVNNQGKITALKPGEVWIKAVSQDNPTAKDSCLVTVQQPVTGITITPLHYEFDAIGKSFPLEASVQPSNATNKNIQWTSTDESVCMVSNGTVISVGVGSCIIMAITHDGGFVAQCSVTVSLPIEAISLNQQQLTMNVGTTDRLDATITPAGAINQHIIWTSSDNNVVSVDERGYITAIKAGGAFVKAISEDNPLVKDSCWVTVLQPVTGITINPSACNLNSIGESITLEAEISPEDASNKEIRWSSSNESVCFVSHGTVVATGYGVCVVLASTEDGNYTAACTVTVNNSSGISDYQIRPEDGPYTIYDLLGRQLNEFKPGVNIIRFANGTIKKVVITNLTM